jgi:hypothetical protein
VISGAKTLIVWGVLLTANTAILWTVFSPDASSVALLGGAGGATILVGAAAWLTGRARSTAREGDEERAHVVPDLSLATVWTAVSIVLLLLGAEMGPWLAYIAGGMLLLGLGGLAREFLAQREELATGEPQRGGSLIAEACSGPKGQEGKR